MISSGLLLAGRRLAVTFGEIQRESESDTDFFHFREEVRSDDFFWNRMAFMYCLKQVFYLGSVSFCTEFTSLTEMFS